MSACLLDGRDLFCDDHNRFREGVRKFLRAEFEPNIDGWESLGIIPRTFWSLLGEHGYLCCDVEEKFGGPGADLLFNMVVFEEIGYAIGGTSLGVSTHAGIVAPYISRYGTHDQKAQFLPAMVDGSCIGAIGMTEPGAGSDLRAIRTHAVRDGSDFVVNGQKTFITNGQNCDFILLACQTEDENGSERISLLLVESDRPGFKKGRILEKIGQKAADTSELFFDNVRVPIANLLGPLGGGFSIMKTELARERVGIACRCLAAAIRAFELTVAYVKERKAFGQPIGDFQNTRFTLANLKVELLVGRAFVDDCFRKLSVDRLSAEEAAAAKLWVTELEGRVVDQCLQFFGGYGYMSEYPVSKFYINARATRLYGGTSEIMREILGRTI